MMRAIVFAMLAVAVGGCAADAEERNEDSMAAVVEANDSAAETESPVLTLDGKSCHVINRGLGWGDKGWFLGIDALCEHRYLSLDVESSALTYPSSSAARVSFDVRASVKRESGTATLTLGPTAPKQSSARVKGSAEFSSGGISRRVDFDIPASVPTF